jgi:hypothetical protein
LCELGSMGTAGAGSIPLTPMAISSPDGSIT